MKLFPGRGSVPSVAETAPTSSRSDLPDSTTLSGTCPRCGFKASFTALGTNEISHHPDLSEASPFAQLQASMRLGVERATVLQCSHCGEGLVVIEERLIGEQVWHKATRGGAQTWRGIFWWPLPAAVVSPDVPAAIGSCYSEGVVALAAGCPRAAAVMARRAMEAVCADKGASGTTLQKQLASLATGGTLQPTLVDWANEVRLVGNKGAHFDPIDPVTPKDAEELLKFVRELLKYLYELPADLKRRRGP